MILEINSIYLYRNKKQIFDNFNLKLKKKQILLLVGENGVGKSSLMDMIVGLIQPNSGSVFIKGLHTNEICDKKKFFTYLPHKDSLKDNLTVEQNLTLWLELSSECFNAKDLDKKLKFFGLLGLKKQLVKTLSHGQRKKVSLTKLLMTNTDLWLLDEPFNGLDKKSCDLLKILLTKKISGEGAVLLSSHIDPKIKEGKKVFLKKKIKNYNHRFFDTWEKL